MYDRIILPTDGSAGMDRVIDHAARLAQLHEATLQAMYVVDTASLNSLPLEVTMDTVTAKFETEGQRAIEQVESRVSEDVAVESVTIEGSPAREIVEHAGTEQCDLVVMGTHGRSGVDRLLLGSVAERVVRRSPVPVLTVRVEVAIDATEDRTPEQA